MHYAVRGMNREIPDSAGPTSAPGAWLDGVEDLRAARFRRGNAPPAAPQGI